MKLLLTSDGITNESIADALAELVSRPLSQIKAAFIITAQTGQDDESTHDTESDQFRQLTSRGIEYRIIDPANEANWRERLKDIELVIIGGGNTFHLFHESRNSGFDIWLRDNANSKVYMGTSAGSIIMTPNIGIASVDDGDENTPGITDLTGLGLIDFEISPHTPESVSIEANLEYSKMITGKMLLMDNQTAIKISGQEMKIISEGQWQWCLNGELTKAPVPHLPT